MYRLLSIHSWADSLLCSCWLFSSDLYVRKKLNREREHTEFALLSSAVLSEELKCVVSTERDTGCDSSQEPNLDTLNYSLEGFVALLAVRCLAACLRALAYQPR